ncbi:MAG: hypothetical protein RIE73_21910 [Coleofasciculus sp. C1-SOL-03]|uniref:hypothetical protein n=1 Tax=Coleofasciculus sp. C1-SOL-03 TaxID=3069522 RepID=UPI0032F4598C
MSSLGKQEDSSRDRDRTRDDSSPRDTTATWKNQPRLLFSRQPPIGVQHCQRLRTIPSLTICSHLTDPRLWAGQKVRFFCHRSIY